ncbi:MAG TPA: aspartate-semialdehyde dehydrogenase, partial [Candidatus Acidoferrales bacterium]|nr:aspartate-semialdehyde dehydrogenase [Candidatus Acidoferrales bacterium]
AFASRERAGGARFRGQAIDVFPASHEALRGFDAVFFAGSEDASGTFAPPLVEAGAIVIDNSSTFRMRDDLALIVPEVNAGAIRAGQRLFPVANCTAIVLCTALAPVRDAAGLSGIRVATYQAASGAGRAGLEELRAGEEALARGAREPRPSAFAAPLARNVIPQVGELDDWGSSTEERKIRAEARKILGLPELFASVLAVRVPVATAHSEAVFFETERPIALGALAAAFERAPGVAFHRDGIVTPREVEGTDLVHVARLRAEEGGRDRAFSLWCVGDQLRKGAATNAVQILELLLASTVTGR